MSVPIIPPQPLFSLLLQPLTILLGIVILTVICSKKKKDNDKKQAMPPAAPRQPSSEIEEKNKALFRTQTVEDIVAGGETLDSQVQKKNNSKQGIKTARAMPPNIWELAYPRTVESIDETHAQGTNDKSQSGKR